MIVYILNDPMHSSGSIMSVPFLLLGVFIFARYLIYPLEVVSPGWITKKRLFKIYSPIVLLFLVYQVTLSFGIKYTSYKTLSDMINDIWSFQVIFRIVLALLMFVPVVLIYYGPYTRQDNNIDREWMRRYIAAVTTNMVTYLIVNIYDRFLICSLYIAICVSFSLYFTYKEMFARITHQPIISPPQSEPIIEPQAIVEINSNPEVSISMNCHSKSKEIELFKRLEQYMDSKKAWQDPDLTAEKVISELYTNRTSLLKAIQQNGYSGYPSYVNNKRVKEFIQIVNQQGSLNYQQAFFDVGFQSKTTALRNFKDITGMIPSEYFQNQPQSKLIIFQ